MCCESSHIVRFDFGPLLQGQTRIAKLKSAYLQCETNLQEIIGWESLMFADLTLGPSFKVKRG